MSLVIPGVQVPGSPIFVPFWYGIIALFIVVVFHEFGHGIVARAHGIPVKNTGLVFFGPLPGAFVEPDEKKINKSPSAVQTSMFASGPFFNAILAAFVALLLFAVINPLSASMVNPSGVQFTNIQEGQPAFAAGLQKDVTYTLINDAPMKDSQVLMDTLSCTKPNDTITLRGVNSTVMITLGANPSGGDNGYLGVTGIKTDYKLKNESLKLPYDALFILSNLLEWIFLLSLGIGLANLLPLGPVDGGRMLHTTLVDMKGKDLGTKLWTRISLITFIVLLILVLVPIIKSVIFKI
jgi:membrane-associated protease RseP (regulator of RpoE activity)